MLNENTEINSAELAQLKGLVMVEFGASWCPHCQAAQAIIADALRQHSNFQHIKVEDGKGKQLGRLYSVKLWPTLVLLNDGIEKSRLVRPQTAQEVMDAIKKAKLTESYK